MTEQLGYWIFFSYKCRCRVTARSSRLHDYLAMLECRADVRAYELHVPIEEGESNRASRFDVRVDLKDAPAEFVNVVAAAMLDDPKFKDRLKMLDDCAKPRGVKSLTVTDVELRENPVLLSNCHRVRAFLSERIWIPDDRCVQHVLGTLVRAGGHLSLENLATQAGIACDTAVRVAARAHADGLVMLDLHTGLLSGQTQVALISNRSSR